MFLSKVYQNGFLIALNFNEKSEMKIFVQEVYDSETLVHVTRLHKLLETKTNITKVSTSQLRNIFFFKSERMWFY